MKPTKQYILDKALTLFNEKGFVNVRLQHIADSAFVSVGHLAYHFKNKDDIILSLYERLKKKQELLLTQCRVLPLFEDIDFMLRSIFQLQQQYLFFLFGYAGSAKGFTRNCRKAQEADQFSAATDSVYDGVQHIQGFFY